MANLNVSKRGASIMLFSSDLQFDCKTSRGYLLNSGISAQQTKLGKTMIPTPILELLHAEWI